MAKNLKVGIIGLGTIGAVHADAIAATGEAELAAICDINASRLKLIGEKHRVADRFTRYQDLLAGGVDAVHVCVGNALHCEVATSALKAGKHVLLEKPMAMNAAQARRIVDARKKSGKVLQMGMVWRQDPAAKVVREYVSRGELGEIYHMRAVLIRRRGVPGLGGWFTTKAASGGGPMIDIGVHIFDMAMWLGGCWNPTAVSARTYAKFGKRMRQYRYVDMWAGPPNYKGVCDVEDYATGLVRFGARTTLSFEIAWAANAPDETFIDILGDKGGTRLMDGKGLQIRTEHNDRPADLSPKFNETSDRFLSQARCFIAACRGEAPPAATAEQGLTLMKVIDAVYESGKKNREVSVPTA